MPNFDPEKNSCKKEANVNSTKFNQNKREQNSYEILEVFENHVCKTPFCAEQLFVSDFIN